MLANWYKMEVMLCWYFSGDGKLQGIVASLSLLPPYLAPLMSNVFTAHTIFRCYQMKGWQFCRFATLPNMQTYATDRVNTLGIKVANSKATNGKIDKQIGGVFPAHWLLNILSPAMNFVFLTLQGQSSCVHVCSIYYPKHLSNFINAVFYICSLFHFRFWYSKYILYLLLSITHFHSLYANFGLTSGQCGGVEIKLPAAVVGKTNQRYTRLGNMSCQLLLFLCIGTSN